MLEESKSRGSIQMNPFPIVSNQCTGHCEGLSAEEAKGLWRLC